jgi:hypothetical protein
LALKPVLVMQTAEDWRRHDSINRRVQELGRCGYAIDRVFAQNGEVTQAIPPATAK